MSRQVGAGSGDGLIWIIWMIIIFFMLSACSNTVESEGMGLSDDIVEVEVDGHEYLVYKGHYKGGMVHKANCEAVHYE